MCGCARGYPGLPSLAPLPPLDQQHFLFEDSSGVPSFPVPSLESGLAFDAALHVCVSFIFMLTFLFASLPSRNRAVHTRAHIVTDQQKCNLFFTD